MKKRVVWGSSFPLYLVATSQRGENTDRVTESLAAHEQEWRQTSRRQMLVNQLDFTPEYKEYTGLGSPGTNPNLH